MADGTKIEWTDATWNPITGCAVVSPGCTHCYAMKLAGTRLKHHASRKGLTRDTKGGPVWTGEVRFNPNWLDQPLHWKKPRMIFVCAHGDLFAEGVKEEWLDQIFAVMALATQHTFQVLTKRPDRMRDYIKDLPRRAARIATAALQIWGGKNPDAIYDAVVDAMAEPLPNVWLGVSVEDQRRAEERIPLLLDTAAAIRWISAEPLLGAVDLTNLDYYVILDKYAKKPRENPEDENWPTCLYDALRGHMKGPDDVGLPKLDWIVAGGESGDGARPMQPEWARSLRDQCAAADVPFLFKQWGNHMPCSDANGPYMLRVSKTEAGRRLDGIEHNGFPEIQS